MISVTSNEDIVEHLIYLYRHYNWTGKRQMYFFKSVVV